MIRVLHSFLHNCNAITYTIVGQGFFHNLSPEVIKGPQMKQFCFDFIVSNVSMGDFLSIVYGHEVGNESSHKWVGE